MYRYVVLIWNPANDSSTAAANRLLEKCSERPGNWTRALHTQGLVVLHSGVEGSSCTTTLLAHAGGAICGRIFNRGNDAQPEVAPMRELAQGARTLLDDYWGRYVAVMRDRESGEVQILRDPTGVMPCFITRLDDVHIVFSDMESVLALGSVSFSIDWRYIAAFVAYSALQIRATGLNEVTEVQAGEQVSFGANGMQRRMVWSPLDPLRRGLIENPEEAVELIRDTVRRSVHTWASLHRSIVHNLSGGLDSSLVLACLMSAPSRPEITCLHYFAPLGREDERKYARLAAGQFDARLIERALDAKALPLARLLQIRRAPRPWFYLYDLEQGSIEAEVVSRLGATAVFSGAGGDGLFLRARAELAVADYLARHGFSLHAMRVALDAARVARTSMWPILRRGVRMHLGRPVAGRVAGMEEPRTLVPDAVRSAARANDALIHPWFEGVGRIPPGLHWHILTLSIPPPFYNSFATEGEVERISPLMSQPLIELCLRIPSYVWISGGRDRSLVRQAFMSNLPATIIRRTQKGAIDRHNRKLLDENAQFLREMLLDGILVAHGLLDRAQLEATLSRARSPAGFEYNELLRQHLCTEVWLRRWLPTSSCAR